MRKATQFPFISCTLKLDLTGFIWFESATANLICGCKACQIPSGNFHYYLVTKLNADATSGTRQLHCYMVKFRFTSLYDKMAAAHVVSSNNMSWLQDKGS